jgi:hypothetical protein
MLEPLTGWAASLPPDSQPAALIEIARAWLPIDEKRGVEVFEQAFAASASLTPSERERLQVEIVKAIADAGFLRSLEMLRALPTVPPPSAGTLLVLSAYEAVLEQLLKAQRWQQAAELALSSGAAAYSSITRLLLDRLPADDENRPVLLSRVLPTLSNPDHFESSISLLQTHRSNLPAGFQSEARSAIFRAFTPRESPVHRAAAISRDGETVVLEGELEIRLFKHAAFLRELDASALARLLEKQPRIRALLEKYPNGEASFTQGAKAVTLSTILGGPPPPGTSLGELTVPATHSATQERAHWMQQPLDRSLAQLTESSASDQDRLAFLAVAPWRVRDEHPGQEEVWLDRLAGLIETLSSPQGRASNYLNLMQAARQRNLDTLVLRYARLALTEAKALRQAEDKAKQRNYAPVIFWESSVIYRQAAYELAKTGPEAVDTLLAEISEPYWQMLLRLEAARAWSGQGVPRIGAIFASGPSR